MTPADFMVMAHRGASAYAPENTLAAFDLALQLECRHLELDVDLTRDGHIVVMPDDTVDRTTNGTGAVASHTLAALRALEAGTWFGPPFTGERIPTYAEVLARYQGRVHLHTELVGYGGPGAAVRNCGRSGTRHSRAPSGHLTLPPCTPSSPA